MYSSERLVLEGGLGQTGRPAQLVRVKDGKSIPIGPENSAKETDTRVYKEGTFPSLMKRTLSEEPDDDSVHRSMARRRKLGPGERVSAPPPQKCQECNREFKRPCDLTCVKSLQCLHDTAVLIICRKHEKTHSRPWKCSEVDCKYHTYGWPTETERDRHVNDKHSADPPMYNCQFPPCTYKSKRESNCKQHMEKAHEWTYVRAKGTGKKAGKNASSRTSHTPQATTPDLQTSGITPPMTRDPSHQNGHGSVDQVNTAFEHHVNEVIAGDAKDDVASTRDPLETPFSNDYRQFGLNIFSNGPTEGALGAVSPHGLGTGSFGPSLPSPFNDTQEFYGSGVLHETYKTQLLTPVLSNGRRPSGPFLHSPDQDLGGMFDTSPLQPMANFSPSGQGNLMLYTPNSVGVFGDDEGFENLMPPQTTRPTQDFPLYSTYDPTLGTMGDMFEELPSIGTRTGNVDQQPSGSSESQVAAAFFSNFMQMDSQPEA